MFALPRRIPGRPSGRDRADPAPSHLGRAVTVTGRLDSDGEVHIHGNVQGRVSADRIVLGLGGILVGDVVARYIRIAGRFTGRIFALDVTLEDSAQIEGKIFHHNVTVARGARIVGRMPWRPLNYFDSLEQLPETQP
ncbi:MAG TPA: polymer-forming cytoskeletal protein [Rhizomicrobium sp.]